MPADRTYARTAGGWQSLLYGPGRSGAVPPDQIRASDAERQEIAETLGRHFAEGRLDQSEFDERMTHAMSAKTRGDLRGILDDLPPDAPSPLGGAVVPPAPRRPHTLLVLLSVASIAVAAGAVLSSPWHVPWILVLIVAVVLLRRPLRWHAHHDHYHHHHHSPLP